MQLKIEYLDKNQLKPYENNAKIHTKEQVEQIKNSINEFGFNDPIAVWRDNEVVEGHGRLLAAMDMDEISEVPIIRLDQLSDEQRRAYMLAHNKLTMNTGFDLDILSKELDNIHDINMDDFGFENVDIDFEEFMGDGDGGGSVMMNGSKLRVVIGAFMCDIDEDQNELYEISRNLNEEKVKAFISLALKNGDLS